MLCHIFMSQLFVRWTLNTGDVNRFQSKTTDKHVDVIYAYNFVIAGTYAVITEFRQIGCYPFILLFFIFCLFSFIRYFVILMEDIPLCFY